MSLFNRPILSIYSQPLGINCYSHPRNTEHPVITLDIGGLGLPVVVADMASLRETGDLIEGISVQRGVEASIFFFLPRTQFYLRHITSVKNADVVLCVLPLPEVLVVSTSIHHFFFSCNSLYQRTNHGAHEFVQGLAEALRPTFLPSFLFAGGIKPYTKYMLHS